MNTNHRSNFKQSPAECLRELEFVEWLPLTWDSRGISVVFIHDVQLALVTL